MWDIIRHHFSTSTSQLQHSNTAFCLVFYLTDPGYSKFYTVDEMLTQTVTNSPPPMMLWTWPGLVLTGGDISYVAPGWRCSVSQSQAKSCTTNHHQPPVGATALLTRRTTATRYQQCNVRWLLWPGLQGTSYESVTDSCNCFTQISSEVFLFSSQLHQYVMLCKSE